jgi:hypothetical protein
MQKPRAPLRRMPHGFYLLSLRGVFDMNSQMITQKSWEEFRACGLLWWVNRGLHLLGWAIVVEEDSAGKVLNAFPARVRFRGFDAKSEAEGFKLVSEFIHENSDSLLEESKE